MGVSAALVQVQREALVFSGQNLFPLEILHDIFFSKKSSHSETKTMIPTGRPPSPPWGVRKNSVGEGG